MGGAWAFESATWPVPVLGFYDSAVRLRGRSRECEAIDALLDGARNSVSASLAIHGEPGVGKSALLAYAADRAADFHVLRASGTPAESGLPFAGLEQLLRPALGHLEGLPQVQQTALAGALGLAPSKGADRFLIGVATLSLLSELAEDRPVLGLVDDLHWLDEESADTLRFVMRRIDREGIAILLGTTHGIDADAGPGSIREIAIVGLDRVASDNLLIELSGTTTPAPGVRAFLWEQTHGNPSALIEVANALTAEQLDGIEPLPADVRRGIALHHTIMNRAGRLPEDTLTVLLVAAAEGTGDTAVTLRAASALGVDPAALEPAELAGMVHVDRDGLVFRDPLLRTAVYEAAPFGQRQAAHRAIAAALDDHDPDRRAWHLSAATVGTDDEVADELERSAERARGRGGHAAASAALQRASDLTSDRRVAGRRLAAAASEAFLAGRGQNAASLADRAAVLVDDPAVYADLDYTRARVQAGPGNRRTAFDLMLKASESIVASDPGTAARMLVDAGRLAWVEADSRMIIEVGRRMDALDLHAETPELFAVDLMKGLFRLLEGDPVNAAPLIGSSLDRVDPQDPRQLHLAGVAAMFTRDDRMAQELLGRALSRAREIGGIALIPPILFPVALLETWEGVYPAARVHASEGERLARDTGQDHLIGHFLAILAWIAAVRGEVDSAGQLAARALELGREYRVRPSIAMGIWAMALSDIGAGKWAEAAMTLEAMVPLGAPDNHPVISLQASADMIEAAQRAERPELAHEIFRSFAGFGRGVVAPWTLALLARSRALIAVDAEVAVAAYEEALAHHANSERRFEEARTRLVYGEYLRRLKRRFEARTQLRSALDIFERLGAAPWEERARSELRATGETARKRDPTSLDQLTPQELQIVRRVAEGATNKEVAAQLFISPRTVAYHLRNVFVKLGISSRAELIRLSDLPVP
jgi:DNA-binding CsgD family transcriptional regulator